MSKISRLYVFLTLLATACSVHAVDSYRYLHVTIDTPWAIFIFLLLIILFPFVLMAVLYWYFAVKKSEVNDAGHE
ncbi:MAG: hypothetical protein L3J84_01685 [Gammaproteobacteria bacterium]|nr:hypothetical protein [Gammaproteobacteria bacterium]